MKCGKETELTVQVTIRGFVNSAAPLCQDCCEKVIDNLERIPWTLRPDYWIKVVR